MRKVSLRNSLELALPQAAWPGTGAVTLRLLGRNSDLTHCFHLLAAVCQLHVAGARFPLAWNITRRVLNGRKYVERIKRPCRRGI